MQELLLLLIVAMFIFGAQKLPEIGRSLGEGIKEFKKAGRELESGLDTKDEKNAEKKDT